MYQRILVPLDGSKLAECVLSHVEQIAQGCNAEEVVLISITERVTGRTPAPEVREVYGSDVSITIGKKQGQAQRYLERIARRLDAKGMKVQTVVRLGDPSEEIVRYAAENNCDLIALASHGRSGISRWAYGSVADRVLRVSPVPVLVVRAPGSVPGL